MEMIHVDDNDVIIELIDLKDTKATEVVVKNNDGSFSIFINSRFNVERQRDALNHAINHIRFNDFRLNNVQQIEAATHGISKELLNEKERRTQQKYEQTRKRITLERKKRQKKLAEYESFANEVHLNNPDLFDKHQQDLANRF